MGILTVKLSKEDENAVNLIRSKHRIGTKTKVLLFCLHNQTLLEDEIDILRRERNQFLIELAQYREHSLEILTGISGLQTLTKRNTPF